MKFLLRDVPHALMIMLLVIVGLTAWSLAELHAAEIDKHGNQLINRLAELQLLLYVAAIVLLPQSRATREALSQARWSVPFLVLATFSVAVAGYAFVYDFTDAAERPLTLLVIATIVVFIAILVDAIRDSHDPPPAQPDSTSIQDASLEIARAAVVNADASRSIAQAAAAIASTPPAPTPPPAPRVVKVRGFGKFEIR